LLTDWLKKTRHQRGANHPRYSPTGCGGCAWRRQETLLRQQRSLPFVALWRER
jgi:hypothetical protein